MKKYVIKFFLCLLIFGIIIEPFVIKDIKSKNGYVKGDLRCPDGHLGVDCTEVRNGNNEVTEVKITATDGKYTVVKSVVKQNVDVESATYDVSFSISPNDGKTEPTAYVVLVLDSSGSMINYLDDKQGAPAKQAAYKFSKTLANANLPIQVAMVQFGRNAVTVRGFDKTEISTSKMCNHNDSPHVDGCTGIDVNSKVSTGLNAAYKLLTNVPANTKKYLYLFGDGDYIGSTNFPGWIGEANNIKAAGIETYGLRFKSRYWEIGSEHDFLNTKEESDKYIVEGDSNRELLYTVCTVPTYFNGKAYTVGKGKNAKTYYYPVPFTNGVEGIATGCYERIMDYIVGSGRWSNEFDSTAWTTKLENDAQKIIDQYQKSLPVADSLVDLVGEQFGNHALNFDVKSLSYETPPQTITITSASANEGWENYTNAGFTFKYHVGDSHYEIKSDVSPQVYWEHQSSDFSDCKSSASFNTRVRERSNIAHKFIIEGDSYFQRTNESVFLLDRYCTDKIDVGLIMNPNGLNNSSNYFETLRGLGFPISIYLNETVECFNFWNNSAYQSLLSDYQARSGHVNGGIQSFLDTELSELADAYQNVQSKNNMDNVASVLDNYSKTFENSINPKITVRYNDGDNYSKSDQFVNAKDSFSSNLSCSDTSCTLVLKKKMIAKEVCSKIGSGEIEDCDINKKNQIVAGNNYYLGENKYYYDKKKTEGTISVEIPAIGYNQIDITMDGTNDPACRFKLNESDVFYRQIDVSDPFIQQFKTIDKREIGRNFLNSVYDFTNVIDSDIWKKDTEYLFKMSKKNIENIKKDTKDNSQKVKSYLGTGCYINLQNKYVCPFIRNKDAGENARDFFTELKNKKNY